MEKEYEKAFGFGATKRHRPQEGKRDSPYAAYGRAVSGRSERAATCALEKRSQHTSIDVVIETQSAVI